MMLVRRSIYYALRRLFYMTRHRTIDKEATPVLTVGRIGPKRSKTPEGFLLCEDVPIARTGLMLYGPMETPIRPGQDGIARVTRDAAALFDPATVASFNGKPVTFDHPDEDVTPSNWYKYAKGIVLNPRRGTADNEDVILADLLVMDRATIHEIEAGRREVSAGYEADYEQTGEGSGRQTNIIGNHVALVARGRCGPRCAIGDHQPPSLKEHSTMGTSTRSGVPRTRRQIPPAVRRAFRDMADALSEDPDALDMDGGEGSLGLDTTKGADDTGADSGNHTHIHIHTDGSGGAAPADAGGGMPDDGLMPPGDDGTGGDLGMDPGAGGGDVESRLSALEGMMQQIMEMLQGGSDTPSGDLPDDGMGGEPGADMGAGGLPDAGGGEETPPPNDPPPKTKDHRMQTGDSAALATAYQALMSDAEVLVPGFRFPTFDSAKPRKFTIDSMCAQRRRILAHVASTHDGRSLIDSVGGEGIDFDSLACDHAAVLFKAAAGAKRMLNNASATRDAHRVGVPGMPGGTGKAPRSIAELNEFNRKYHADMAAKQRAQLT